MNTASCVSVGCFAAKWNSLRSTRASIEFSSSVIAAKMDEVDVSLGYKNISKTARSNTKKAGLFHTCKKG